MHLLLLRLVAEQGKVDRGRRKAIDCEHAINEEEWNDRRLLFIHRRVHRSPPRPRFQPSHPEQTKRENEKQRRSSTR